MKKKFKDSENGKKPENEQREEAPEENAVPEEAAEETESVLDLKPLLEASRQKAEEYLNLAQRVQADFDNFRKRNQSVRADAYEEGGRDVIASLLPVIDNLERAVGIETTDDKLHTGVEMVLKQLNDLMEKRGVTVIDRQGEPFDPNLENAVMQGTPEDGEKGTVCQVLQKGYKMGNYVLRTAMVKVVPE
ncbi:MAG: nucleotide exchange factor GrpE [Clostridia bacterium]|nr:nucleotide exchange factor GrpE [Clostridia bacterium]